MSIRSTLASCTSAAALCSVAHASLTQYVDLGGNYANVTGMSADGSTILASNQYDAEGWIWRELSGVIALPSAVYPRHGGLNHDGSQVVGGIEGVGAFRLQIDSMQYDYPPSNTPDACALAISPDGQAVLYTSNFGTFLWRGATETRVCDARAFAGNISDDGRAVGLTWEDSLTPAAVWTKSGGFRFLAINFTRELHVSSDGRTAAALEELTDSRGRLSFWNISESGDATRAEWRDVSAWSSTGASPDLSMIGIAGSWGGWFEPTSLWTRADGFGTVSYYLAANGVQLPPDFAFLQLNAVSADNQRLAGTNLTEYGPRIWVVDLDRSCPGELTFDAIVDDSDFVVFAAEYDGFICSEGCRADFNRDGFVSDDDFVIFAAAYDAFRCP